MPLMQVIMLTDDLNRPAASLEAIALIPDVAGEVVTVSPADDAGLWRAIDAATTELVAVLDARYALTHDWWMPLLVQLSISSADPVPIPVLEAGPAIAVGFARALAARPDGRALIGSCFEAQRRRGQPVTSHHRDRISVIVPTFNRLALLPRALDALVAQTHSDFEVVVVNDGGLDPSGVLDRYRDRFDITLVTLPANIGRAGAYNAGLGHCSNRWATFVADDDSCEPGHLANLLDTLGPDSGPAFTYGPMHSIAHDINGNILARRVALDGERSASYLLVENFVSGASLFDCQTALAIGGFDESFEVMEDWDFWIRMAQHCEMRFVVRPTYEYRLRPEIADNAFSSTGMAKFFRSQERIYERYPVEPGSVAEQARTAKRASDQADQEDVFPFEQAIGVVGTGDVDELIACVRSIAVASTRTGERVQLIIHEVRNPGTEAALTALAVNMACLSSEFDPEHAVNRIVAQAGAPKVMVIGSNERL